MSYDPQRLARLLGHLLAGALLTTLASLCGVAVVHEGRLSKMEARQDDVKEQLDRIERKIDRIEKKEPRP